MHAEGMLRSHRSKAVVLPRHGLIADRRIASLDGLRALSIALVFLGHLTGTSNFPVNPVTELLGCYARVGVEIFFVISGFLITTLLLREREQTGRIDLLQFYKRRTLRIFPAAFAYITLIAIVARPAGRGLAFAYSYTMCYAGQGRPWVLGHLWSLSVEEQFYLAWPLIVAFAFSRRRQVGMAVMLLAPVARFAFWCAGMHAIDEYFPAVSDSLMAGCLLACYRQEVRARLPWLTSTAAFGGLLALVAVLPFALPSVRMRVALGGLPPMLIALMIHAAIERRDWLLNNPVTARVGVLSYALYLCQQPFLNRGYHAWWTAFPTNVVLAVAGALAMHYLVERRFLRHENGRKLRSGMVPVLAKRVGTTTGAEIPVAS